MDAITLKNKITEQIFQIQDVEFLNALKTIIQGKISNEVYVLSDFEKERIESARKDVENGNTIPHDQLQNEIEAWLNSK